MPAKTTATKQAPVAPKADSSIDLVRKFRFESLLLGFSSTFINLPTHKVDDEIEHWLRRVVEFLDIDAGMIIQRQRPDAPVQITHAGMREGYPAPPVPVALKKYCLIADRLLSGDLVTFTNLDEFSETEIKECRIILDNGIKSLSGYPFTAPGGAFHGAVIFASIRKEQDWPVSIRQRLWLVSQVFASALIRRSTEQALLESERRFEAAARCSTDIIWDYDVRTGLINWIGDIDGPLGYNPGEFPREFEEWTTCIHPDDYAQAMPAIRGFLEKGKEIDAEFRVRRKDGDYVIWKAYGAVFEKEDDKPVRYVGACKDITGQRDAEDDARELRNQLSHFSRVSTMGELAASLAHEINQPLAAILSNAQAAQRFLDSPKPDLDEVREALADIVDDGQRAGAIIRRIRGFLRGSKTESGPLSINGVIQEVIDLLKRDLAAQRVKVTLRLAPNLPAVAGDRIQLLQVALNLTMNAMDAMDGKSDAGHELEICTASANKSAVTVSFRDNGKGFGGTEPDAVFEPFYTTRDEGMGMGLAICRSIVEAHGGKLSARAEKDRGAVFEFTLPLFKASSRSQP